MVKSSALSSRDERSSLGCWLRDCCLEPSSCLESDGFVAAARKRDVVNALFWHSTGILDTLHCLDTAWDGARYVVGARKGRRGWARSSVSPTRMASMFHSVVSRGQSPGRPEYHCEVKSNLSSDAAVARWRCPPRNQRQGGTFHPELLHPFDLLCIFTRKNSTHAPTHARLQTLGSLLLHL